MASRPPSSAHPPLATLTEQAVVGVAVIYGEKSNQRFDMPSAASPTYRLKIERGAFKESLRRGDLVEARIDHDPARTVASTADGSLHLWEDNRGVFFALVPPQTPDGWHVWTTARFDRLRTSFKLKMDVDDYRWTIEGGDRVASVSSARLVDVAPTERPCFPNTWVRALPLGVAMDSQEARDLADHHDRGARLDRILREGARRW